MANQMLIAGFGLALPDAVRVNRHRIGGARANWVLG